MSLKLHTVLNCLLSLPAVAYLGALLELAVEARSCCLLLEP
jgi:hypothetical protein